MTITPAGYVVLFTLILAIILSVLVSKRISKKNGSPNGCFGNAYIVLVVFSVVSLFVGCFAMSASQTYSLMFYPKYESTIVDVNSEWVEQEYEDDRGFTRSKQVEMHTALLEFYDGNDNLIRLNNNISSGAKPILGDKVTVAYRDGRLYEFSLRSILLLIALTIMMIILGLIGLFLVLFALGKSTDRVKKIGFGFILYFFFPASMVFIMCAMLWAVWDDHMNNGDMPIWAQGAVIFFSLILFLSLISYTSLILKKRIKPDG